jgi:hypothetical protein
MNPGLNTELRPRSLGEVLDGTVQLYRSHFALFVGIAVFPRAILLVWQLIQLLVTRSLVARHLPSTAFTIGAACFDLLLYFVLVGVALAATNCAVSAIYLDQPASIALAYEQVKPHWFRYLRLMFVSALYAWGPAAAPYIAILAVVGINGKRFLFTPGTTTVATATPGSVAGIVIIVVAAFAMLVTIPYGIWMSLRYAVAVPASIFENIGVRASLKRSVFLTLKGRGRIFVMVLMVGFISWIILMAAEAPFLILGIRAGIQAAKNHQPAQLSLLSQVASQIISFIVYSLIGPIYGIAITLFYYDERIRKEGFDIEWMMHRANLTGVAPVIAEVSPSDTELG